MCGVLQVPTNEAGAAWVVGSLYGILSTPDLDLLDSSGNYSLYTIRETFGYFSPIIEKAWTVVWYPYSKSINHRSWISHMPIISTLIRLLYMFPLTALAWFFFGNNFQYYVLALICADTVHAAMDARIWRFFRLFSQ